MKDILQKWLQERLGLLIEMERLAQYMKDGTILVRILKHYDAVNSSSVDILPSQDDFVCKINLIQLKVWFKLLGVDFNDEMINDILKGKISSCVNILYRLYLCLENKNSLHFVPKQKERLMRKRDEKFSVSKVSLLDLNPRKTSHINDYQHSCRMLENNDVIKWYEDKHCKKKKAGINESSFLAPINIKEVNRFGKDGKIYAKKKCRFDEDIYYVRNELDRYNKLQTTSICDEKCYDLNDFIGVGDRCFNVIAQSKRVCKYKCASGVNSHGHILPPISSKGKPTVVSVLDDKMFNDEKYLRKLHCSFQVSFKSRRIAYNVCDSITNEVWDEVLDKEEDDFRKIIAQRLLKQSFYERELSMKFFQIMNQSEVQKQSYVEIEKRIKSKRQKLETDREILSDGESVSRDVEDRSVNFDDYVLYYQDERKRTVELHRRLYAEKLKLRFQKHYALCLETVEDIIEIVIKKSEFKSLYEMPVPDKLWRQWKCLFHHGLPVFDIEDVCFDLKNDVGLFEMNRQTVLNECDLDDYLDISRDWDILSEQDLNNNVIVINFSKSSENQYVVGYIVHRLLENKYPCQPPPKPANIPKFPFRVILNDIDDENVIIKLKSLLAKSELLVFDVNSAANFCLQCYKDEIGYENYQSFAKKGSKSSASERGCVKLSLNANISITERSSKGEEAFKVKSTQTSLSALGEVNDGTFPSGEAAKLGGELFSTMLLGNELPTNLIVEIIIEYIKSNSHKIKGWVLVNFPSTLFQASVLEYTLTSKKFPFHLEDDTASVFDCDVNLVKELKDNNSCNLEVEVKSSRIVPNPRECDGEDVFKTYFSKYLTAIKGEVVSPNSFLNVGGEEFYSLHSESTLLLEHPEREGVPAINEFYREQGISYDFVYEMFDLTTVKQLARHIIAPSLEDNMRMTSIDLFGEDVLYKLAETEDQDSKVHGASGIGRTEFSPTKAVKNNVVAQTPVACDHVGLLSSFELDHHVCSSDFNTELCGDLEKRDTSEKPGDRNWIYSREHIPDSVVIALASFWESLETDYLNNLKEVFYLKRNTDYSLIPYIHYVMKTIDLCLNQSDERQLMVTEFLDQFNGVHQVLRSDEEMKVELHLRVYELKEKLIKLCENKKESAEEMRTIMITQNWTYLQMAAVGNCFLSLLQIEMDRCTRTLDLIKDYYYAMLSLFKSDPSITNDLKLSTIELGVEEDNGINAVAAEVIKRMLSFSDSTLSVNPIYSIIESKAREVCSTIEKLKPVLDNIIAVEEVNAVKIIKDLFSMKHQELTEFEKKPRQSKKEVRSKSKDDEIMSQLMKAVDDLKEEFAKKEANVKNMFFEWSCGIKGEVDRTQFRVELIKKKALLDLVEIENGMVSTFNHFYDAIMVKFNAECFCVNQLCLLFQLAIEEKTPLHADITFNQDHLHVIKREVEKIETVVKLPPALEEMLFEESFTIKQLEEIKERLKYVAPDGIISQGAFIALFQSMIMEGANHGSVKLVPKIWNKLHLNEFNLFFQKVFGNSGLIEWRDFLIYCLDLPYPLTEDIIDARLQFLRYDPQETETVSYESYMSTTLWFHRELPETPLDALHNILAKEFLFSLYKIEDENLINYSLLLMAFCKDEDLIVGFGKGLSLLYGKAVIMFEEDLFLEKILTDNLNTGFKVVRQICDDLLEDVMETSLGVMEKNPALLRYREHSLTDIDLLSGTAIDFGTSLYPVGSLLTESMYDQFFRRHLALQWTSRVPYVVIVILLSMSFFPVFMPFFVYDVYSRTFEEVRAHIKGLQKIEDYFVYMPAFLKHLWLRDMLKTLHKFRALSLTNVIKEIISNRKSSDNS